MGQRELSKHFDVTPFLPHRPAPTSTVTRRLSKTSEKVPIYKRSGLWGALRDLRDLAQNSRSGWKTAKAIENSGCRAAYIRVQALTPLASFLRRKGIRVFLEANGIQFEARRHHHHSWLSQIWRRFERNQYASADHVFFVGSYGRYWKLPRNNWTEVENGIEPEMLRRRKKPTASTGAIKLVMLARLVAHHRGSLIVDAIPRLSSKTRDNLELHLVGTGFDQIHQELSGLLPVIDHGFLARDQVSPLLRQMDVGLITDGPPFASQMKLLDYAAAGCLVVAPNLPHLLAFYSNSGIQFFDRGSPKSLKSKIEKLVVERHTIMSLAQNLHEHVRKRYTWETIFKSKAATIAQIMSTSADK